MNQDKNLKTSTKSLHTKKLAFDYISCGNPPLFAQKVQTGQFPDSAIHFCQKIDNSMNLVVNPRTKLNKTTAASKYELHMLPR